VLRNFATRAHSGNYIALTADYTALVGTRQGTIVPARPVSTGFEITAVNCTFELYRKLIHATTAKQLGKKLGYQVE